jgi:hypothetical protein
MSCYFPSYWCIEISYRLIAARGIIVYTNVDIFQDDDIMSLEVIPMRMAGIREVRAKCAGYLGGSEPFLVTKHGKVSGVYIPLESPDRLPDDWRTEIGKSLSHYLARLLELKRITERDIREDFRAFRDRRRRR